MVEKISEFRRQMEDGTVLTFVPKKAESAVKDSEGQTITLTYATKAEFQPVKDAADNAVRKDTSASQTMNGDLIVNGYSLSRAVIAYLDGQEMTNKVMRSNNRPQLSLQGNAGVYVDLQFKNSNGEKKITFNSKDLLIGNPSETADSSAIVNKAYVSATDGVTNNLVHTIGYEKIASIKTTTADGMLLEHGRLMRGGSTATTMSTNRFYRIIECGNTAGDARVVVSVTTLNSWGVVRVSQISGAVSVENAVGNILGAVNFTIETSGGKRHLYVSKSVAGDIIVQVLNFNVNGVNVACTPIDGYEVKE